MTSEHIYFDCGHDRDIVRKQNHAKQIRLIVLVVAK